MGKRLIIQKRGKGSPSYRSTKKGLKIKYIDFDEKQKNDLIRGEVERLFTDQTHSSVLAEILFENNEKNYMIAAEGMRVGQQIQYGKNAGLEMGNVLLLNDLPEGCPIFNIESIPGDGGELVRSSGLYALIVTKDKKKAYLKMPSGKTTELPLDARATVGCTAGGGREEKPLVKAGTSYHRMKSKARRYPTVRGVAMNALDHPFGGSGHHAGKSKSTNRNAPPGRMVGAIASKRTGRRKKS